MERVKLSDLPPKYRTQALRQIANIPAVPTAEFKSDTSNESVAKEEAERCDRPHGFTGPVSVSYRDRRKRLLDSDNGWTKYHTDALVTAGVLRDDTPQDIPKRPSVIQRKIEKGQEEGLTIEVVKL